jgi:hypothetical protein
MKTKKDKPKAKAKQRKSGKSSLTEWVIQLENRVTRLEQAQLAPIPPQSLPEGGLPPQTTPQP